MSGRVSAERSLAATSGPAPDLAATVDATPLVAAPFEHVYFDAAFSPAYYRELLERLPATASYRELRHRQAICPVPLLVRDLGGYHIGIHGDSLDKAITVQFYPTRDASQQHLGTIFHEGREGAAAARTTPLAFLPATGYAFPVVYHESWHSVARRPPMASATRSC